MSQRKEKQLRQLERRVTALENQAAARQREAERMWQIHIQPAESVVDAPLHPRQGSEHPPADRGLLQGR